MISSASKEMTTLKVIASDTLDHWVYELESDINPYAYRLSNFIRHYDGVHVLLKSRE
jgi:hypothetical protein